VNNCDWSAVNQWDWLCTFSFHELSNGTNFKKVYILARTLWRTLSTQYTHVFRASLNFVWNKLSSKNRFILLNQWQWKLYKAQILKNRLSEFCRTATLVANKHRINSFFRSLTNEQVLLNTIYKTKLLKNAKILRHYYC